jgi:RNA polymerase II C-terminal domain phosphatase-like 3/4
MGNKLYATEMAKLLDPKGELFAGRVISRGDDSVGDPFDSDDRVPKSKDLDGVLGMESAVVIIDDSIRVWPHNKHNLIVVERYLSLKRFLYKPKFMWTNSAMIFL